MMTRPMDRRELLRSFGGSALVMLGGGIPSTIARPVESRGTLVVVFMRGAADALHMIAPYRDPRYRPLRGALALEEPGRGEQPTLDLGDGFAFHPALSPLYPFYSAGRLAPVVAVGSKDPTRSHFDAQDAMETGTPGTKSTRAGWLTRAVAALGLDRPSPFTAVSLTSQLPRSLSGTREAMALEDLARLSFPVRADALLERIEQQYRDDERSSFAAAGDEAFRAMRMFRGADPLSLSPRSGVRYPRARKPNPFEQLAKLIRSDLGVRVAFVEQQGWDTHFAQGASTGAMANLMRDLAQNVAAFVRDVGETNPVTVLMVTEFGRTVEPNGAGGTDHGHGAAMLVLGPGVRGGRVHGDWLGLATTNLHDGRDLPVTTDFRDVFSEVAERSLALDDVSGLFPGYRPRSVAVMGRG